jgi:hypothetical protein
MVNIPPEYREQYQREQRLCRAHVKAVITALRCGDAERFRELIEPYDGYPDFWEPVVRRPRHP